MNISHFFKNNWIHFAIVGLFAIIVGFYFSPQFSGFGLVQHDIEQYEGMARESKWFKEKTDETLLWSNGMFGGMPTVQTSLIYPGNFIGRAFFDFAYGVGIPASVVFLNMLGFYFLMMAFRVRPWIAVLGALTFGFSSYEIIILAAGHNSKALAVSMMAPVIGSFIWTFRRNFLIGLGLSAFFMTLQLSSNHYQVSYYLGILLLFIGAFELVRFAKKKELKKFFRNSLSLLVVYLLAVACNYGSISLTSNYASHTTRGGSDLTVGPDNKELEKVNLGLSKEYITNWSYGVGESFTLISPYVKGGGTVTFKDSPHLEILENADLKRSEKAWVENYYVYWGDQPMTSGPVYIGAGMFLLFVLGLVFLKDRIKWPLFITGVLALMLSWGKNFMWLTDIFIDYVPGYAKFRTVTIILVLVELIVPFVGVLFLNQIIKEKPTLTEKSKKQILIAGGAVLLFFVGIKFTGIGDNYYSTSFDLKQRTQIEDNLRNQILSTPPSDIQAQIGINPNDEKQLQGFIDQRMEPFDDNMRNVKAVRSDIFHSSMNRSIIIVLFTLIILGLLIFTTVPMPILIGVLGVVFIVDMMGVSLNYLNKDEHINGSGYWVEKEDKLYPIAITPADEQILAMELAKNPELAKKVEEESSKYKNEIKDSGFSRWGKKKMMDVEKMSILNSETNYRVFDLSQSPFNSSRASYFHKSIGGYHGAKLSSIQDMIDFHLSKMSMPVLNMLNVKYFIQNNEGQLVARENREALGEAWLVKELKPLSSRNQEILSLGKTFLVENLSQGQFFVNDQKVKSDTLYGSEKLDFVLNGDQMPISIPNSLVQGMVFYFVKDRKGTYNFIPEISAKADTLNSFDLLLKVNVLSDFDPRNTALSTDSKLENLNKLSFSGLGTVEMVKYHPMKLEYKFNSTEDQFVVFPEMYYSDNWKAYIDDKEVDIFNVNYCLRGLPVESGEHKIIFEFSKNEYRNANYLSAIFCVLIILFLGFGVWRYLKQKPVEKE